MSPLLSAPKHVWVVARHDIPLPHRQAAVSVLGGPGCARPLVRVRRAQHVAGVVPGDAQLWRGGARDAVQRPDPSALSTLHVALAPIPAFADSQHVALVVDRDAQRRRCARDGVRCSCHRRPRSPTSPTNRRRILVVATTSPSFETARAESSPDRRRPEGPGWCPQSRIHRPARIRPSAGSAVVNALPSLSTTTHRVVEGHDDPWMRFSPTTPAFVSTSPRRRPRGRWR